MNIPSSQIKKVTGAQDCEFFYGVDVSKDDFVAAVLGENGKYKLKKFDNTDAGIEKFIKSLSCPKTTLVTMEATGTYSMKLAFALGEVQIPTAVLNPKQSKGFISGVLLSTTKTDNKDACALALYGRVNRPPIYIIPDNKILEIKQLRSLDAIYKKQKAALSNKLHAISFHPKPCSFVVQSIKQNIANLEVNIKGIEEKLCDLSEENFNKLYELAITIKGIGKTTATALLVATNGCSGFKSSKQLAKFLGVCPTQNESGSSVRGRGSLAKTGAKEIRALLYMCARVAKRFNLTCKDLYERLRRKGKGHKVAMNAVAHKLVKQFYAVITTKTSFDNEFHIKKEA